MSEIERFVEAQDAGGQFESALQELRTGRKRGHWIWYVFPQIAGLGTSSMSRVYAIAGLEEAGAYLQHPVLLPRLATISAVAAEHLREGVAIETLMGSAIDAAKLVSSMTLFSAVADRLRETTSDERLTQLSTAATEIMSRAAAQGYAPCAHTLAVLGRHLPRTN